MDISILFGTGNRALVSKMVTNVFTQQPKYIDDLHAILPTIVQVSYCTHYSTGELLYPL